MLSNSALDAGE